MPEIKTSSAIQKDDLDELDNASLAGVSSIDDEASLTDALSANPLKMAIIRGLIKLKNHISIIPLILCVVSMVVITFTIHIHVNALVKLRNNEMNAFYFFVNCLLSLILCLAYLQVYSKKATKKKRIVFFALFICVLAFEIFLDFYYIHDINVETNMFNSFNKVTDDPKTHYIADSLKWTNIHLAFLFITGGVALLAPVLQPLASKIRIRIK